MCMYMYVCMCACVRVCMCVFSGDNLNAEQNFGVKIECEDDI